MRTAAPVAAATLTVAVAAPVAAGTAVAMLAVRQRAIRNAIASALTKFDSLEASFDAHGQTGAGRVAERLAAEGLAGAALTPRTPTPPTGRQPTPPLIQERPAYLPTAPHTVYRKLAPSGARAFSPSGEPSPRSPPGPAAPRAGRGCSGS